MTTKLHQEWKEFLELLQSEKVDFVVVGGISVAFHARPRFTGDIDIFVSRSKENAERIMRTLKRFGFGEIGITVEDFQRPDYTIQLGREPRRIDILTGISGVDFDSAWSTRVCAIFGDIEIPCISRELLIRNKEATGRYKDLDDVENLRKTSPKEIK